MCSLPPTSVGIADDMTRHSFFFGLFNEGNIRRSNREYPKPTEI